MSRSSLEHNHSVTVVRHIAAADTIAATGRGLKEGRAGQQNIFKLFIEDPSLEDEKVCDRLDVDIEGPGESQVWAKAHGNGTITVTYYVSHPGKYQTHIKFDGQRIQGSPFRLNVK